jgi:hypothetical protein
MGKVLHRSIAFHWIISYNENAMYIRTKTFTNKDGTTRTYLYLVEAKRSGGTVRRRRGMSDPHRVSGQGL